MPEVPSSSLEDCQLATAIAQYLLPPTRVDAPKQVAVDLIQDLANGSVNKAGEGRFDSQSLTAMCSWCSQALMGRAWEVKICVP